MDRKAASKAELERMDLLPADVGRMVRDRDGWTDIGATCRCCGRWTSQPAVHHIRFRSQGGLDTPDNLITLAQQPGHDCHLSLAHGPNARSWREAFLAVVDHPGITATQYRRWQSG